MRKAFLLLGLTLMATRFVMASAQSANSGIITFSLDQVSELFMPPELYIDVDFIDENSNRILEALESGVFRLTLSNRGGNADNVSVAILNPMSKGLMLEKRIINTSVKSNEETVIDFPISATIDVPTDSAKLDIKVSEALGYDLNATVGFTTYEFLKSKIELQGVTIIDAGVGLRPLNNNPDGKVQKSEVVRANVTLQNTGVGVASNVKYTITSSDPNVRLLSETGMEERLEGNLNDMLSGEVREISFRLSANNNYNSTAAYLPVYITVKEEHSFGDLASTNIPIPLGKTPDKPRILDIKGETDKLLAQQIKVSSSSDPGRFTSNQKIRDISIAPAGEPIYKDAVAIVIGAEKNSYGVAPAPYAARDAEVMAGYFRNSLGIEDIKVLTNNDVTKNSLSDLLDSRYGYLSRVVKPGETDVFVYYSGHGIPDAGTDGSQDIFLFPYDAMKELVAERGYSLNKLYADLNSLNARSVTVILDACFSGSSRQTVTIESENISNEKGVRISMPQMTNRPWDSNPNFRVFTSSAGDQTSLGYDQSQSGLFTYYLATGLQGDADSNKDGSIQFSELVDFVTNNVSNESRKIRGGAQNPQFFGNGNFTIARIK
ncbi:MAG: caspase family protein [Bacteroidaceae bacterium]|nr:caspase family protein [Bacteroidaceae bacterium]